MDSAPKRKANDRTPSGVRKGANTYLATCLTDRTHACRRVLDKYLEGHFRAQRVHSASKSAADLVGISVFKPAPFVSMGTAGTYARRAGGYSPHTVIACHSRNKRLAMG